MNYWDSVEAATQVINDHGLQIAQSWGMTKFSPKLEGVAAMIQQAALDFLSQEFKGFPKELVVRDLSDREDELYPKWVAFAEKIYGINNHAAQETGWEMIMGGPYGDPGLTDFPKRGALHQSKKYDFASFDDPWKVMSPEDREEANRLFKLAMKAYPSSPKQIALRKKLNELLKKYKIGQSKEESSRIARSMINESFDKFIVRKGRYRVLEPDSPIFSHMKIDELMGMTGSEIRALWLHHLPADVLFNLGDFFDDKQLNALGAHPDKDIARDALDALL